MIGNPLAITGILIITILVVPIVCRNLRIPGIVGLILAGVLMGPHGLGLLERDYAINALSQVGVLYIMFLSGIEIDMDDFRQERRKGFLFGLMTFLLPLLTGLVASMALGFGFWSSLLLASMMGSHTLMTYTTVSRHGIQKNPAVSLVIGATIVAVTASMVLLALVAGQFRPETGSLPHWLRMFLGSALMVVSIFAGMPRLVRWCFYRTNDVVQQWLLVMTMALIGGYLAWLADLEPILGVFLTALALNRLIPNQSPLMNRVNFAGNALFVPIFLVGVGMLIDLRAFVTGWETAIVAGVMLLVAVGGKWLAAWLAQRAFRLDKMQRALLFGLTNSHAAGALATVMIGYGILLPDGSHLLNETVLNATIILILVSCTISSFVTDKAAASLHEEAKRLDDSREDDVQTLLPAIRTQHNRKPKDLVTVLQESRRKIPVEDRVRHVVANFAVNSDASGYADAQAALLHVNGQAVWFCHFLQPLSSFSRVRVLMPEQADTAPEARLWKQFVERLVEQMKAEVTQETLSQWQVLPRIADSVQDDELLLLVQARPQTASYNPQLEHVPTILAEHFSEKNFIVLFPAQERAATEANDLIKEVSEEASYSFIRRLRGKLGY